MLALSQAHREVPRRRRASSFSQERCWLARPGGPSLGSVRDFAARRRGPEKDGVCCVAGGEEEPAALARGRSAEAESRRVSALFGPEETTHPLSGARAVSVPREVCALSSPRVSLRNLF